VTRLPLYGKSLALFPRGLKIDNETVAGRFSDALQKYADGCLHPASLRSCNVALIGFQPVGELRLASDLPLSWRA
jgi:hypothetical protein